MKQTFEFTEEEVLMIITALGVFKNRIGQQARWKQRKRMPVLRGRLADCITICDDQEAKGVRKAMANVQRNIDSRIARGQKAAELMNSIKQLAGVKDERLCDHDIEED